MAKFNVHLMSPMMSWEDVEAENAAEAVKQCDVDPRIDLSDGPFYLKVEEVEEEEEEVEEWQK